jgi:hypothetical protein
LRSGFKQETDCAQVWLTWQDNIASNTMRVVKIKLGLNSRAALSRVVCHLSHAAIGEGDYAFVITPGFYSTFGFHYLAFVLRLA